MRNIDAINQKSSHYEVELLSALVMMQQHIPKVYTQVSRNDFQVYGNVYGIIVDAFLNEKNINTELVGGKIQLGLFTSPSSRDIRSIVRDLKDTANAVRLWKVLAGNSEKIPSEGVPAFASEVQKEILSAVTSVERERSEIATVIADWKHKKQEYTDRYRSGMKILGVSTGYEAVDGLIDGIRPEHLWVIGGYTNTGKTFASLNIVANLIAQGKRVVFYSLEMSSADIISRLVGIMTKTNGNSIMKGFGNEENISEAVEKIVLSKLSVHTQKSTLEEIEYSMYEEMLTDPVCLFVVDFVQLVTVKNARSEYETITASALAFQQAAKRLKATVILLSQISNEGAKNGSDSIMSFKGSGALGAAADLAIEISNSEDDRSDWKRKLQEGLPVEMKWAVKKNRHGRVGVLYMNFTGSTGVFDYQPDESKQ